MDPTTNLHEQLALARSLVEDPDGFSLADAHDLAEHVLALDRWLRSGGFLPKDWQDRATVIG